MLSVRLNITSKNIKLNNFKRYKFNCNKRSYYLYNGQKWNLKTTLLETIIGHHALSNGSIKLNKKNIEKLSPFERAKSRFSICASRKRNIPTLDSKRKSFDWKK